MTGDCYHCGEEGHAGNKCPNREYMNVLDVPNLSDESIYRIYREAVANFEDGAIFVELGSFAGGSACYLADLIERSRKKITLYCVDLWNNMIFINVEGSIFHEFWDNVYNCGFEQIIRPIQADSARAAALFENNTVDFVYVDGDHSYKGCERDIVSWLPKLKADGWIGGHDYNQEVEKVVEDIFPEKPLIYPEGARSFLFKEIRSLNREVIKHAL